MKRETFARKIMQLGFHQNPQNGHWHRGEVAIQILGNGAFVNTANKATTGLMYYQRVSEQLWSFEKVLNTLSTLKNAVGATYTADAYVGNHAVYGQSAAKAIDATPSVPSQSNSGSGKTIPYLGDMREGKIDLDGASSTREYVDGAVPWNDNAGTNDGTGDDGNDGTDNNNGNGGNTGGSGGGSGSGGGTGGSGSGSGSGSGIGDTLDEIINNPVDFFNKNKLLIIGGAVLLFLYFKNRGDE